MSGDVFYVKQGDNLPSVTTTLLDPDDAPVDLTGATVEFRMVKPGTTVTGTASVNSPPTAGQVTYDWDTGDTDEWGGYALEWIVTQGADVQTFPSDAYNWVDVVPNLTTTIGGVCTLMDVRRALGRAMTDPETMKAISLIEQLTAVLQRRLNRIFDTTEYTETHHMDHLGRLLPYRGPVLAVSAISVDGTAWAGDVTEWRQIRWPEGSDVEVTYTAGSEVDAGVSGLVAQVVARTLLSPPAIASGAVKSYSVEGTSITYGDVSGTSTPTAVGRFTVGDLAALAGLKRPVVRT